jgi:hypothetical protein
MSFPAEVPGLRRREAILTLLNQPGEGRLGGGATGRAGARAHRGDDFRDIDLALRLYVFPQCCRARLFGVVGENVSIDDKSTGHGIDLLGVHPRAGLAEIAVEDPNALRAPAELLGLALQIVLPPRALLIGANLPRRRLASRSRSPAATSWLDPNSDRAREFIGIHRDLAP